MEILAKVSDWLWMIAVFILLWSLHIKTVEGARRSGATGLTTWDSFSSVFLSAPTYVA